VTTRATGVCFTRNPASGERTNSTVSTWSTRRARTCRRHPHSAEIIELGKTFPKAYQQLLDIRKKLEKHYKDMQDIEFTIENSEAVHAPVPQRQAHRFASVRIAVEMVEEKLISKEEALRRVEPEALNQLLRPVFETAAKQAAVKEGRFLAKGLPAGPWRRHGAHRVLCRGCRDMGHARREDHPVPA